MRPARLVVPILFGISLQAEDSRQADGKQKAELTTREIFAFSSGGTLVMNQSVGDVLIEGWDQTDIEVTTIRSSRKSYRPEELGKGYEELERIAITPSKEDAKRFVISTEVARGLLGRGAGNVQVAYRIKVPFHCNLRVRHETGQVKVRGVAGHMDVTARVGAIQLRLPDDAPYAVDAKSRTGEVNSEISGWTEPAGGFRRPVEEPDNLRKLHLRTGVGSIHIKKQWRDKEVPKPKKTGVVYLGRRPVFRGGGLRMSRSGKTLRFHKASSPVCSV